MWGQSPAPCGVDSLAGQLTSKVVGVNFITGQHLPYCCQPAFRYTYKPKPSNAAKLITWARYSLSILESTYMYKSRKKLSYIEIKSNSQMINFVSRSRPLITEVNSLIKSMGQLSTWSTPCWGSTCCEFNSLCISSQLTTKRTPSRLIKITGCTLPKWHFEKRAGGGRA
jgi:hypothetical protein